jgi:hypothetical protein
VFTLLVGFTQQTNGRNYKKKKKKNYQIEWGQCNPSIHPGAKDWEEDRKQGLERSHPIPFPHTHAF